MPDPTTPAEPVPSTVPNPAPASQPDVAALIADALKAERDRVATENAKAKEAADAEAAKKKGEFEQLYNAEKKAREDADAAHAAERYTLKAATELRDYLAEKHPTLSPTVADYILPRIPAGLTDKARAEAVAAEADKFAKLAPAPPVRGGVPVPTRNPLIGGRTPTTSDNYAARTYPGPKARA